MKLFQVITSLVVLFAAPVHARKGNKAAKVQEPQPRDLSNAEMAFAGAAATAFGVTVMHPVDTIKTLQQSAEGSGLNILAATNKIMKDGGLGAMYKGLGPYVTSDAFAGAFKFAT